MTTQTRERAATRISELAVAGLDLPTFWREAGGAIGTVVPHTVAPCWFTMDPASLLATSHFQEGMPEIPHEWLHVEYLGDDVNKMADVARTPTGVSTLLDATGGRPETSPRYLDQMLPYGVDQEVVAALRSPSGEVWGALGLYREPGESTFSEADCSFLQAVAPHLAQGARRGLLLGEATDPEGPEAPGLLVLDQHWEVESATPGVDEWLADLPGGEVEGRLPTAVLAVAGQAQRTASHPDTPGQVAMARVLSRSGRWVVLHGATLVTNDASRVAVIIERAHPGRIVPLLMAAYQLTEREQDVTRLVLQGLSTQQIADALFISPHTVGEHLKKIFEKTGVRSRRDLVGSVFFTHYEPRVRDNEARVLQGRSLRGGPVNSQGPKSLGSH